MTQMTFERFSPAECARSVEFARVGCQIGLRNLTKPMLALVRSKYRYARNTAIACNGPEFNGLAALRPAEAIGKFDPFDNLFRLAPRLAGPKHKLP